MSEANLDSFETDSSKALATTEKVAEAEVIEKPKVLPKDIASLTDEQKAEIGHGIQTEIIDDGRHVMARYLRIGKNLYAVAKYTLYKQLGCDTFDEWRAQPELQLSRATSYALMKVYEVFVEKLQVKHERLTGLDWTKLYNVSRLVTAENVDEMLTKVETLSRADLQRELSATRARLSGKTPSQADAHVADLDFVRECCPIGCGTTCSVINKDEDTAIKSFKTFLGKWKSIHARIKSLFGQSYKKKVKKKHEQSEQGGGEAKAEPKTEVPPPPKETKSEGHIPSGNGDSPAAERGEPHVQERPASGEAGAKVHGENADQGSTGLEASNFVDDEVKGPVWPV